ncbi:MAG: peptidoglycan D,D-transpeptidase FtsI family protein [Solirubrobacteraceae bacterium]
MNRPITRLFALVVVLFALLVAFTSRWTIFEAASLRGNRLNVRGVLAQQHVARGEILAANGETIAKSVPTKEGTYARVYPMGSLFTTAIGYFYANFGSTGLERSRGAQLTGRAPSGLQRLLNQLEGASEGGDTIETTLRPSIQRAAVAALAGRPGAVVALDPKTGEVEAMASSPSFAPAEVTIPSDAHRLEKQEGSPFFNRATEGAYAPGSTFKIVTLSAALNAGIFTPQSRLSGRDGLIVSGVPLHNDSNSEYGDITLTEALAQSVNTVYAQVAEHVGPQTLTQYMKRFGFYSDPPLDFPSNEMTPSGVYAHGRLSLPTSGLVATDIGRVGIGQGEMEASPLQMAEVVATIADGGKLMRPHLARRVIDAEGRTVEKIAPKVESVVVKPSVAAEVTTMMEAVVKEGTGTGAQIPGVPVAGKTGTAETEQPGQTNDAWFVAFAPANNPKVAVAATLEKVPGYGATYALPVAKQVIEAVLRNGG